MKLCFIAPIKECKFFSETTNRWLSYAQRQMGSGSLLQTLDADDMINYDVFVGEFGQPGLYPSEEQPSPVSIMLSFSRGGGRRRGRGTQHAKVARKKYQKPPERLFKFDFDHLYDLHYTCLLTHSSELSQLTPAIQP